MIILGIDYGTVKTGLAKTLDGFVVPIGIISTKEFFQKLS